MESAPILTAWDTALLALPFIALLALWVFRLDQRLAAPARRRGRRHFGLVEQSGQTCLTDPDGRVFTQASLTPARRSARAVRTALPAR